MLISDRVHIVSLSYRQGVHRQGAGRWIQSLKSFACFHILTLALHSPHGSGPGRSIQDVSISLW
jgi:hypothetical protein